jgi:methionyl-tRNA formyltransferase
MRIVVLTTETTHHAHFVSAIKPGLVLCETAHARAPYPTMHPFESERYKYERKSWFGGADKKLADFAPVETFENINDAAWRLGEFRPDVAICFGTRLLKPPIISACKDFLNLHGGDPQAYRGLDTHLWAIWHRDFQKLETCLHAINESIDDGGIVSMLPVPIRRGMKLHEFRRANTELCVDLVKNILAKGEIRPNAQRTKGRYYGAMPSELKAQCVTRFEKWTTQLA